MPSPTAILGCVALDARSRTPLHRQLYLALRRAILDGQLKAETRLPPTRTLAGDLRVSRNTVLAAFDQLTAEGYLCARVGSGTRVASIAPEILLRAEPGAKGTSARERASRGGERRPATGRTARDAAPAGGLLSRRGLLLSSVERIDAPGGAAFRPGFPARTEFPSTLWGRLLARRARGPRRESFGYAHAVGLPVLRAAIAAHFGAARGLRCTPEQVIVVTGAQAGLDLATRMLIDPDDPAWIEEPGYLGARGALVGAGARLVPVPVDRDGLDLEAATHGHAAPRLIYITPSHQYPTGATMSLPRRLALLELARRTRAWILEDDYDSEYRYAARPIAALQGLDRDGVVIYVGTFSKTMFPALRAGYLVVPESLIRPFRTAIRLTGQAVPPVVQAALADFIGEGHFAAHVRRMRLLYAERQARLVEAAKRFVAGALDVRPADAGMQVAADLLVPRLDDRAVSRAAQELGVIAPPLSQYYLGAPARRGLHLGYAGVPPREIPSGMEKLARAIETAARPARQRARRL